MPAVYAEFVTSEGNFTVRLFDQEAPNTVANFVGLAEGTKEWTDPRTNQKVTQPYYDGVIFHRVIDGFMIQGGDPLGQGIGGPGYKFADEFHPNLRHNKAGHPVDGQPRAEHQRRAVLHHARADAAPRRPALGLRRSRERHGRGARRSAARKIGAQDRPVKDIVIQSIKIETTMTTPESQRPTFRRIANSGRELAGRWELERWQLESTRARPV